MISPLTNGGQIPAISHWFVCYGPPVTTTTTTTGPPTTAGAGGAPHQPVPAPSQGDEGVAGGRAAAYDLLTEDRSLGRRAHRAEWQLGHGTYHFSPIDQKRLQCPFLPVRFPGVLTIGAVCPRRKGEVPDMELM